MSGRCPCSGPGSSAANDTVAVVSSAAVLARVDAARGRGPAVEHPRHRVLDGVAGLAAAQELQMHVGRQPVGVDGAARRGQALRDELPAEGTLSRWPAGRARSRCRRRRPVGSVEQLRAARSCHGARIR